MMEVKHRFGSYVVRFAELSEIERLIEAGSFVVTDSNLARLYPSVAHRPRVYVAEAGERSKSLREFGAINRWLAANGANRASALVAFGGGVVGDLAGFVAASYMRGIRYVQAPTTLLAQVDSSVGGKVAVDIPEGKNLVGAFYAPSEVLVPIKCLQTLTPRDFRNGVAEVVKTGFIMDANLLERLESCCLTPDAKDLAALIERAISLKARVVAEDEYETTGLRAILNFGHTVGHAIERTLRYQQLLHGEAVAVGMVVEAQLAEDLGVARSGLRKRVEVALRVQGLPASHQVLKRAKALVSAMRSDKKSVGEGLAFSLVGEVGSCKLYRGVEENAVVRAIRAC